MESTSKSRVIPFFTWQERTLFVPLRHFYPECYVLIKDQGQLHPLFCMEGKDCPKNAGCATIMAHRSQYLLDKIAPQAKMLVVYYKKPGSHSVWGLVTTPDMEPLQDLSGVRIGDSSVDDIVYSPPFVMKMNPFAFRRFMTKGRKFEWSNTEEFYRLGLNDTTIIPVESLIRDDFTIKR